MLTVEFFSNNGSLLEQTFVQPLPKVPLLPGYIIIASFIPLDALLQSLPVVLYEEHLWKVSVLLKSILFQSCYVM